LHVSRQCRMLASCKSQLCVPFACIGVCAEKAVLCWSSSSFLG
jgi:hypothetical protein